MRIHKYYMGIIIALGAGCVWCGIIYFSQQTTSAYFAWPHLTLFILLGLMLNRMTGRLLGAGRRYAIAFFAPILLLGPAITTLLVVIASLLQGAAHVLRVRYFDERKKGVEAKPSQLSPKRGLAFSFDRGHNGSLITNLFHAAQAAIAIMCSGQIYLALGGKVGRIHAAADLIPAILAGVSLFLIEILLSETAVALEHGHPVHAVWSNSLVSALPVEGSVVGLGLLLTLLYQQPHLLLPVGGTTRPLGIIFVALVVLVPCALLYYSYHLYLEMRRAYERTLRTLSGLVEVRLLSSSQASTAKREGLSTPGERSRQTAQLAAAIAEQIGVSQTQLEHVRLAGYLLEVGKIGLQRDVLTHHNNVLGSMSPRQRKAYARHVELGSQILEPVEFLRPVALLVRHQQERYDGLGHPSGLKGENIPLGARILSAAQAYTELAEGNEVNAPLSAQQILNRLNASRGIRYDPKVLNALAEILRAQGLIAATPKSLIVPAEA